MLPKKPTSACRSAAPFAAAVQRLGEVDSTMRLGRLAAQAGHGSGHTLVANSQRAGRGRSGAPWVSPPGGGLYATVVLWPHARHAVTSLSAAMSLAVAQSCLSLGAAGTQVKWPNDVLGTRGKLAGLLLEQGLHADGQVFVLLGVGLNVQTPAAHPALAASPRALPPSGLRQEGAPHATPDAALGALLQHVGEAFERWQQHGFAVDCAAFDARHAYAHKHVVAMGAGAKGEDLEGVVGAIAADGSLALVCGDVHVRLVSGSLRPVEDPFAARR